MQSKSWGEIDPHLQNCATPFRQNVSGFCVEVPGILLQVATLQKLPEMLPSQSS